MGVFKLFSSSSHDKSASIFSHWLSDSEHSDTVFIPNPRADNYKILKYKEIGDNLILIIKYLDCTNYEGKKILVFKNVSLKKIMNQGLIDPHFSENKNYYSPFARFEPTKKGWKSAQIIAGYI
jgi:hypothetical protein